VCFPNFIGGTIEISQNKESDPNEWYHKREFPFQMQVFERYSRVEKALQNTVVGE